MNIAIDTAVKARQPGTTPVSAPTPPRKALPTASVVLLLTALMKPGAVVMPCHDAVLQGSQFPKACRENSADLPTYIDTDRVSD